MLHILCMAARHTDRLGHHVPLLEGERKVRVSSTTPKGQLSVKGAQGRARATPYLETTPQDGSSIRQCDNVFAVLFCFFVCFLKRFSYVV
jgi:hypothetical protein